MVNEQKTVFRTGEDLKMRVYYWQGSEWVRTPNKITIPEGYYIVSPFLATNDLN